MTDRRCAYCGHRCKHRVCQYHADLTKIERSMLAQDQYDAPAMRDDLLAAVNAAKETAR